MRLNLRGALKDVEDAGVAQHAADAIFQRKAVAAVDLQGVVCSGPRNARAQQLGHARLHVTATTLILFPSGEIGELTGDHDLHRHHRQLAGDAGEFDQRLAELLAILGILHADIHRGLSDTDGARGGLDAGALEGFHELLEALALFPAQQVFTLHFEIVKVDGVFLHAAIAEHLDLTTRDTRILPRCLIRAGRLFREEHGQAAMVRRVRDGAGQNGHHMGARGVGDPRLVAVDGPIAILALHGLGAQGAEVGARVRLRKHGRRQDLARRQTGQPLFLLLLGAAADDQLRRDLRPGAEGADANIAARQFLGHDAHGRLRQAKSAKLLRDGQAEHAHLRQFFDDLHRDQFVLQVPFMGVGDHLIDSIAAELLADHLQLFIKARCAHRDLGGAFAHQFDQTGAGGLGVALRRQAHDLCGHQPALVFLAQAQILQAHDLALVHLDAAIDLPEVLPKSDLLDQVLHLTELAIGLQPLRPVLHLAQAFHIGGQPCQTVCGGLIVLNQLAGDAAIDRQAVLQAGLRSGQNGVHRGDGGTGQCQQVVDERGCRNRGKILSIMGHCRSPSHRMRAGQGWQRQPGPFQVGDDLGPSQPQRNKNSLHRGRLNENVRLLCVCPFLGRALP